MSPEDLAQATNAAKIGVLWALLIAAVIVIVFLAMRLVQTREQMRKGRGYVEQAAAEAAKFKLEASAKSEKMLEVEAQVAAARREERRAVAIRLKTERRLKEQNVLVDRLRSERDDARKDRDWLKRFVDHVET